MMHRAFHGAAGPATFGARILALDAGTALLPALTSRPTPGAYYQIRRGDTLFGVAREAYGSRSLANARRINEAAHNLRFWRPAPAGERQMFPDGRISFNPRFACDVRAQVEASDTAPAGQCFAVLWIPPVGAGESEQALFSEGVWDVAKWITGGAVWPGPATLFDTLAAGGPGLRRLEQYIEVVAYPGEHLVAPAEQGDLVIHRVLGEGDLATLSVVTSESFAPPEEGPLDQDILILRIRPDWDGEPSRRRQRWTSSGRCA